MTQKQMIVDHNFNELWGKNTDLFKINTHDGFIYLHYFPLPFFPFFFFAVAPAPCCWFVFSLCEDLLWRLFNFGIISPRKRNNAFPVKQNTGHFKLFLFNPLTPKFWLLILPSSCYTFPCKLATRIWHSIKVISFTW